MENYRSFAVRRALVRLTDNTSTTATRRNLILDNGSAMGRRVAPNALH
jgi:hypothetical protein